MSQQGTVQAKDTNVGVGVLVTNEQGQFATIQRSDNGRIQVPSGFVQEGESEVAAAIRELQEETGIEVLPEDLEELHVTSTTRSPRYVFFSVKPGTSFVIRERTTPDEGQFLWSEADAFRNTHRTNAAALEAWNARYPKTE